MARWKGKLSIHVNRNFFAIYYGSGVMRRNVYCSAVFTGGRPLSIEILPEQGCPLNRAWHQKQETLATRW